MSSNINYTLWADHSALKSAMKNADMSDIGNKNGVCDTQEEKQFVTKLIKTVFDYNLDFNGDVETQAKEIGKLKYDPVGGTLFGSQNRYLPDGSGGRTRKNEMIASDAGTNSGKTAAKYLTRFITDDDEQKFVVKTMKALSIDYSKETNSKLITNYLKGYYKEKGFTDSGYFEQLGSEGTKFKVGEVLPFMQSILNIIPEDKQNTSEYKTLKETCEYYEKLDSDADFEDSGNIARFFGKSRLDDLDDAIEDLLGL